MSDSRAAPLPELLAACWKHLAEGAGHPGAIFHTPVLGTPSELGCELRTVILREVDPLERLLLCHTDARSPKAAQIGVGARACWLFHDPGIRTQIRAAGRTTLHTGDTLADRLWGEARPRTRLGYLVTQPPGTPLPAASTGLPPGLEGRAPSEAESAPGRQNFAVVRTVVDELDWLELGDDGNLRAQFSWWEGQVRMRWVSP